MANEDPLARWLEGDGGQQPAELPPGARPWDEEGGGPRRRWLLAAAAIPWVVVAVVGVAALARPAAGPAAVPAPGDTQVADGALEGTDANAASGAPGGGDAARRDPAGEAHRAGGGAGSGDDRQAEAPLETDGTSVGGWAGAVGATGGADGTGGFAAERGWPPTDPAGHGAAAWIAPLALRAAVAADGQRWVESALVETVADVGEMVVATLVALVLERQADGWSAPRLVRFSVPLLADGKGRMVAAGPVWALPAPAAPHLSWQRLHEQRLADAAAVALRAAGYADLADVMLARSAALPGVLRVTATARAPGEQADRPHELWLRDEAEPVVLGYRPETGDHR